MKAAIVKERLQNQKPRTGGLSQFLPASPQKAAPNPTSHIFFYPGISSRAMVCRSYGALPINKVCNTKCSISKPTPNGVVCLLTPEATHNKNPERVQYPHPGIINLTIP